MTTAILGQLMEQALGVLRNEKISAGLLAALIVSLWAIHAWANDEFVKKSEFQELTTLMVAHTEEFRIVNASQLIRDLEMKREIAEATAKSDSEIEHLDEEINEAKTYRKCLIDRKPNCIHIKPPE